MTRKAGMLWKTPWRRRTGGFVSQPPVNMWFFDLGGNTGQSFDYWFFESAAALPSFAEGPGPFWMGAVCKAGPPTAPAFSTPYLTLQQYLGGDGIIISGSGAFSATFSPQDTENANLSAQAMDGAAGSIIGNDVLQYNFNTAIVFFARFTPRVSDVLIELFVDNQFFVSAVSTVPYSTPTGQISLFGNTSIDAGPSIHGIVGGTGAVTDDQVSQWFADVKAAAQIVAVPGLTTDLWSAAAVSGSAPVIPNPLPNLAGGQNLSLLSQGTPIQQPSNVLIPVSFNY